MDILLDFSERFGWQDGVDIALLTLIAYRIYLWMRGQTALHVVVGMTVLVVFALTAEAMGLVLTAYVVQAGGAIAALAAIVVFQDEIRRAFRNASPLRWWQRRTARRPDSEKDRHLRLSEALVGFARKRIGALVVLPRVDPVDEHLTAGTAADALVSAELLEAIFQTASPIHDGATVIRGHRIERTGAFLPLSTQQDLPDDLGTRHRAAVGLTERCDAVVFVVSEERGDISVVVGGRIRGVPASVGDVASRIGQELRRPHGRGPTSSMEAARGRLPLRHAGALVVILLMVSAVWFLLVGDRSTVHTKEVLVELRGVSENREVSVLRPPDSKVRIRLRGPRQILFSRAVDQVSAWIDVSDVGEGRVRLPIEVAVPRPIRIVGVDPERATVRLEKPDGAEPAP